MLVSFLLWFGGWFTSFVCIVLLLTDCSFVPLVSLGVVFRGVFFGVCCPESIAVKEVRSGLVWDVFCHNAFCHLFNP